APAATEEGREEERIAAGIELAYEHIGEAVVAAVERPRGGREAAAVGLAGEPHVALEIDGRAPAGLDPAAAEERPVHQRRIDHQRLRRIVGADLEAQPRRPAQREPALDLAPRAADVLPQLRRALSQLATGRRDHELTRAVDH